MNIKDVLEQHKLWLESGSSRGRRADLTRADLRNFDLSRANLSRANLSRANLRGADLTGADLWRTDLSGTDLRGAIGLPDIPPFPIDAAIAKAVEKDGLNMRLWHNCDTVHCRAGWAVTLHPQGPELEREHGTSAAAAMIYNACSSLDVTPDWYASNEDALADIRRLA